MSSTNVEFVTELMEPKLTKAQKRALAAEGYFEEPSAYSPEPNIYTKALDEGAVLRVVAQPTMKDGKLHRLFITGAKLAPKRRIKA